MLRVVSVFLACAAVSLFVFAGVPAQGGLITITQLDMATAGTYDGQGESFMPSVNDGYAGPTPTTVALTDFTLQSGGGGSTIPGTVYLSIFSGWTAGAPYGTATGLVGTSTNAVTAWSTVAGTNIDFSFDSLSLNYTTKYYALLTDTTGNLAFKPMWGRTAGTYSGGNCWIVDGAVNGPVHGVANFSASFQTVPEPGMLVLLATGLLGLLCYAWRKRK